MKLFILLVLSLISIQSLTAQWESYEVGFDEVLTIWDMDAVDENTVWALGLGGIYSNDSWGINPAKSFTTTSDGGASWTTGELPCPPGNWAGFQISAIGANTAWVAASNFSGGAAVYKTIDGGLNWDKQMVYDSLSSFTTVLHFWDENNGITIGAPRNGYFEIYTTEDGGTNWNRVPETQIEAPLTGEQAGNFTAQGNHCWFGTSHGRILHSADKGLNWTGSTTPIAEQASYTWVEGIAFQDSLVGIAHSAEYMSAPYIHKIVYTEDGGETWIDQAVEFPYFSIFHAHYIPGTSILTKTSRGANGIGPFATSYSLDHGITWTDIETETPIMDFDFVDNETGWGGKFKNDLTPTQLYKYTGNPLTSIFEIPTLQAEVTLSPNPTSDVLKVDIALEESAELRMTLMDITGKVVKRQSFDKNNSFSKVFDLSAYPSGIYTLSLQTKDAVLTEKILKF